MGEQRVGYAQPAPYLYFTVVALEAIQALFSERTRLLGLLNEEQQRLAQALQLRWDLTQSYWSRIARFGNGRWPLEDLPWRTTDRVQSDYFSLLVTSIVVQDLVGRRGSDEELSRVGQVLDDLASRGRITRRAFTADPALALHSPGETIELDGSAGVVRAGAALGAVRPVAAAAAAHGAHRRAAGHPERRQRLLNLADNVWDHLELRRLRTDPGRDLWDQPSTRSRS